MTRTSGGGFQQATSSRSGLDELVLAALRQCEPRKASELAAQIAATLGDDAPTERDVGYALTRPRRAGLATTTGNGTTCATAGFR